MSQAVDLDDVADEIGEDHLAGDGGDWDEFMNDDASDELL